MSIYCIYGNIIGYFIHILIIELYPSEYSILLKWKNIYPTILSLMLEIYLCSKIINATCLSHMLISKCLIFGRHNCSKFCNFVYKGLFQNDWNVKRLGCNKISYSFPNAWNFKCLGTANATIFVHMFIKIIACNFKNLSAVNVVMFCIYVYS